MITLCIRYQFDPAKISGIQTYFEEEQKVIERSGGKIVGYFMPTDFAGPTNEALGLIDLPSMAAYETYRQVLADDPENKRATRPRYSRRAHEERQLIQQDRS